LGVAWQSKASYDSSIEDPAVPLVDGPSQFQAGCTVYIGGDAPGFAAAAPWSSDPPRERAMNVFEAIDHARNLAAEGRREEGLRILLDAAAENSDEDLDGEIALAYTELGLGKPDDEALGDFAEARSWMELPFTLAAEAEIHVRRGDFGRAGALADRAMELNPEDAYAPYIHGLVQLERARFGPAEESLRQAVELAPNWSSPYPLLARALDGLDRQEEAHGALLEGARLCPADDDLLVELAQSFANRRGDAAAARQVLQRATELNRNNAVAWRLLARASAEAGEENEARRAIERALEIDPEGTTEWLRLAGPEHPVFDVYLS
jgi:Flp pilus assembly protein TadD